MYVNGGICVAVSCGILEICENVKYVYVLGMVYRRVGNICTSYVGMYVWVVLSIHVSEPLYPSYRIYIYIHLRIVCFM